MIDLVIISAFFYLEGWFVTTAIALLILIGVRTDFILFTSPFFLFMIFQQKMHRIFLVFFLLLSLSLYCFIGYFYNNQGWSTIFYHTLVEILTHPITVGPSLGLRQYIAAFTVGVKSIASNTPFLLYALLCIYTAFMLKIKDRDLFSLCMTYEFTLAITCFLLSIRRLKPPALAGQL